MIDIVQILSELSLRNFIFYRGNVGMASPTISGITTPQSVASGSLISVFNGVGLTDTQSNPTDTATIEVQVSGTDSDSHGTFDPSIKKIGAGTYTYDTPSDPKSLANVLSGLAFNPTPNISNAAVATTIKLTVTDTQTKQSSSASLTLNEQAQPPNAPVITGITASQAIAGSVKPFSGVTVSDNATGASDTITIRVTDENAAPTDSNGKFAQLSGGVTLVEQSTGLYTLSKSLSPTDLTTLLDGMVFNASGTKATNIQLTVVDQQLTTNAQLITLSSTPQGTGDPQKAPDQGNKGSNGGGGNMGGHTVGGYIVTDTTTNSTSTQTGKPYSGPVVGLTSEYVNITHDGLNITSQTPNSFIKSGSGDDAIDVSKSNGTNVLDGSTGSNFMVGGSGNDTFFVDDRAASADIWSTISGFHAGDSATVFGVNQADFGLDFEDDQGATGFTGLTLHATAIGKSTASFTLVGFSKDDMTSGKLGLNFGQEPDGTNYLIVTGH
jgi:hypothetical protein